MHAALHEFIKRHSTTPLTGSDLEAIDAAVVPRRFRKRQFLHQEGEVCDRIAFIMKGSMRQYSLDNKGIEHVVALAIENWWVGDRASFEQQVPSTYFVDAWEDTDALVITRDALLGLSAIPAIHEVRFLLSSNSAIELLHRVNTAISLTAEERYAELEKQHPEFLQRFPQHIIASYLGMTKETLSRVRSHSTKK
jgi:CRP-like cAMP-binding protein